jgi:hypothetical protein
LPERSRCALHGSCKLLDWRLALSMAERGVFTNLNI